jgi:ubiquinone/menaquinone biosynthesis C-methylase UbiE
MNRDPQAGGDPSAIFEQMLDQVSASPRLWNTLRWLVEAGYSGEKAVIEAELQPWKNDQRRFIDFGCGTGAFALSFPTERYLGIDVSRTYIQFAGRHYPTNFMVCSGKSLALAPASFDAALVMGVLHHLEDEIAQAAMTELARVLKPAATALVIEDIPPPDRWNLAGHAMHWLDRGGHIRDDAAYRTIFGSAFVVQRSYAMRSGICDYGVYVLERAHDPTSSE